MKHLIIIYLVLLGYGQVVLAQSNNSKEFLNYRYQVCDSSLATYFRIIEAKDDPTDTGLKRYLHMDGELAFELETSILSENIIQSQMKSFYKNGAIYELLNFVNDTLEGVFFCYHDDGALKTKGYYKKSELNDSLITFYKDGTIRRKDYYDRGELINGFCFSSLGADTSYFPYETEAEFPGGTSSLSSWIGENIVYPDEAIEFNDQGRVYISFVVEKNGWVSNVTVERGVALSLDKEAQRVVKSMPSWKPGELDGYPIRTRCHLPINFVIDDGSSWNDNIDTAILINNYNWKRGNDLKDPLYGLAMDPYSWKGELLYEIYYIPDGKSRIKKRILSPMELENLKVLKFISKRSCKNWHKYNFNFELEKLKI